MRNTLLACAVGFGALVSSFPLSAYDTSPKCYHDLGRNFFRPQLVSQALSMHNVPQGVWTPINQALQEQAKSIPDRVKRKAAQMRPNPLDPVFLAEPATELLKDTLYETFYTVLMSWNSYQDIYLNEDDIKDMFGFISSSQESRIQQCLGIPKK